MTSKRIALVVGTRPEAIKMAPVYRAFRADSRANVEVISSGQHRELLQSALASVEMPVSVDLDVMTPGQSLNGVLAKVVERMGAHFEANPVDAVLLQGDTTTPLAAAQVGYHLRIPVGHVEAGLRTYDHAHPFPEEGNRQLIDRLARWCFVPTEAERRNLRAERIDDARIFVTGNTAVDRLLWAIERSDTHLGPSTLLLTLHRRESFGGELDAILEGLRDFLERTPEAKVIWPVHPNPEVKAAAARTLGDDERVHMAAPMP
ncbi:MAG: UDP-N-acetylglucosamine 2-epimerase (non-hydrolyzing) [Myxococcales bacterium]|nr:UDP-N-acetylglucosamine 2-epimerase (non-hydrolyzing) [Myxococcales bacterium]